MKKLYLFFFFIAIISMAGCSKSNPTSPTNTGYGHITAKIDGTTWQSVVISGVWPWAEYQSSPIELIVYGESIAVNGSDTSTISITFSIPNVALGTYQFDNSGENNLSVTYYNPSANPQTSVYYSSTITGVSGTLTLTKFDLTNKIVQGTFTCQVKSLMGDNTVKSVTDGSFDVKITKEI